MSFTAERDITYIFSPLSTSQGIDVVGNVPSVQEYDPASGTFTPDYTLTNLVLRPWLCIIDPDGVLQSGRVEIANPVWHVVANGSKTAITSSSADFSMVASGEEAGTLTIKRNAATDAPIALLFTGEYTDTRTGRVHKVEMAYSVLCMSSEIDLKFGLDLPRMIRYDPIRDTSNTRIVTPWMTAGGEEVPAANRKFVWHKKDRDDASFAEVGSDIMDYDVQVAQDGGSATVDLDLIGHRVDLRVYFFYNPYGPVTDTSITADTRYADITFLRVRKALKAYIKTFTKVSRSQTELIAEVDVLDSKGIIPDPDSYVDVWWKLSKGAASGAVSYGSTLARGSKATLPLSGTSLQYGGTLGADVRHKEPLMALTDSSGAVLTDGDGNVLIG